MQKNQKPYNARNKYKNKVKHSDKKKRNYVITKEELFNFNKPKYNGFGGGYGPHGDTKYNRRKNKQDFYDGLEFD